jgi:aminoglycoside phosphotransferase (APT) family kinase protein
MTSATENVPGIVFERLVPWFSENVEPVNSLSAEVIGHGRSNITYRLASGDKEWVLRRPPLSHVLPTAHDMKREFRVISALEPTGLPVPHAIALCEDPDVTGAQFYIMSFVRGLVSNDPNVFAAKFPEGMRRAIGENLIDTLAELHAIDPEQVGLGDFGKPRGYVARQVKRFAGQIEQHKTRDVPELDELARRLQAATPPETDEFSIVHGDYRIDNCVLDDDGRIAAILDWEMATLGDPLTDIGLIFMYWADKESGTQTGVASNSVTGLPGFMTRREAIERYGEKSGRDMSNLDFYIVLAHFKLAVIVEGIYARFLEGGTVGTGFEAQGQAALGLARGGLGFADRSSIPALRG